MSRHVVKSGRESSARRPSGSGSGGWMDAAVGRLAHACTRPDTELSAITAPTADFENSRRLTGSSFMGHRRQSPCVLVNSPLPVIALAGHRRVIHRSIAGAEWVTPFQPESCDLADGFRARSAPSFRSRLSGLEFDVKLILSTETASYLEKVRENHRPWVA